MSKVDWSLAPEGATHYCDGAMSGFWRDLSERTWKFFRDSDETWHDSGEKTTNLLHNGIGLTLIERPKPKQWSGPEDGLPPVGSIVEIIAEADEYAPDWNRYADHIGKVVTIIAHEYAHTSEPIAVYSCETGVAYEYHSLIAKCFRAIKTPEQIAAESRESAIRELMDIAQVDCRVTAARLVDAGFKREGV